MALFRGCPELTSIFSLFMAVLSWLSCHGLPVMVILSWPLCHSLFMVVQYLPSDCRCPVTAVLPWRIVPPWRPAKRAILSMFSINYSWISCKCRKLGTNGKYSWIQSKLCELSKVRHQVAELQRWADCYLVHWSAARCPADYRNDSRPANWWK